MYYVNIMCHAFVTSQVSILWFKNIFLDLGTVVWYDAVIKGMGMED